MTGFLLGWLLGMIDWVTAKLPCLHQPLNAGSVVKVAASGEIEWETPCRLAVVGSHEQTLQVKSSGGDGEGRATVLLFHGNPSKFLQGHNLFGSGDLMALMVDAYARIVQLLGLQPTEADWQAVRTGQYEICRIDYNQSFSLPSRADVLAWLRAAEFKAKTRHGRPSRKGGTLYFGKHSRRWSLKFYCKGEEISVPKHRLPDTLQISELIDWADDKLRAELTLRTTELLDLQMRTASAARPEKLRELFGQYMRTLEMSEQIALTSEELHQLPQRLRSTYILWNSGEDLRDTLPKATYYRHRKDLLELGIDIALRKEMFDRANVVPLVRVLEAMPAEIPVWAYERGLVHHSARRAAI